MFENKGKDFKSRAYKTEKEMDKNMNLTPAKLKIKFVSRQLYYFSLYSF